MSRVNVRIGSLIVHGSRSFAADTFSTALRAELEQRLAPGRASTVGRRFVAQAQHICSAADGLSSPKATFETMTAARIAGRLLR